MFRLEAERLAAECNMKLYRTSVKEDLNVAVVFQHLAENYVNKVSRMFLMIMPILRSICVSRIMTMMMITNLSMMMIISVTFPGSKHGLDRLRLPQPLHRKP